ncbi:prepilin peptidase [Pseudomonas sp. NPDC089569]|uniref:prepilin peptidase n=1 Tax=Pseudomonas sp. NPDC089569 TaxID=3390722 RepID=UPI003D01FC9E
MPLSDVLVHYPAFFIGTIGLLGLVVGSFLNVVIHRLPMMMEREWRQQAAEILDLELETQSGVFNLAVPRSRCPKCNHQVRPWENIPVVSWVLLRGRCSSCSDSISVRYPLVELAIGLISAAVAFKFGYGVPCFAVLLLVWACVALAMIDIDHQFLPDSIVQPWIWLGLLASYLGMVTSLESSFIGVVTGYLSFALPAWLYSKVAGRTAMGAGDYKVMALFGAWLGWQMLPVIFLLSSIAAAIFGVILGRRRDEPYPFGPFIIVAGLVALFFGHDLYAWYAHAKGIRIDEAFFK